MDEQIESLVAKFQQYKKQSYEVMVYAFLTGIAIGFALGVVLL